MKRMSLPLRLAFAPALLSGVLVLGGCGDDAEPCCESPDSKVTSELIVTFTDQVVVPTYARLATRLTDLDAACKALATAPSADKLSAAKQAWQAARVPWEQSEGFLFGPADSFSLDPAMDNWPLNHADLEGVLAGDKVLTPQFVRGLPDTQKGFHTVEYLIFGDGGAKTVAQITPREFEYLVATSEDLKSVGEELHDRWRKSVDGNAPFRDTLATAGQAGNSAYPSVHAAAQEIVKGVITILDEVANGKIAEPFDSGDPNSVESQFAYNSLSDFTNNIRSVENVYLGHLQGETKKGTSLQDVVGAGSALDVKIRGQIAASISALAAIPEPFREAINDDASADEIRAAQTAIRTLLGTFQGEVQPLVSK
ncbi:peptidase M75 [Myxococcus stipitatus]|uniref:imelysin family protein n=1 Tax=Myxococcus stipitatus TaxID=83455 RepID=UPI003145119C